MYVSCWLKCHEPGCFLAALLNSQPLGFYSPAQLVRDARQHGITVRAVDVVYSDWDCTLERAPLPQPAPGGALPAADGFPAAADPASSCLASVGLASVGAGLAAWGFAAFGFAGTGFGAGLLVAEDPGGAFFNWSSAFMSTVTCAWAGSANSISRTGKTGKMRMGEFTLAKRRATLNQAPAAVLTCPPIPAAAWPSITASRSFSNRCGLAATTSPVSRGSPPCGSLA